MVVQDNLSRYAQAASSQLPNLPALAGLIGTYWPSAWNAWITTGTLYPLQYLIGEAPSILLAHQIVQHFEIVVNRWQASLGNQAQMWLDRTRKRLFNARTLDAYREWQSVSSELLLRDYLAARGVSAIVTPAGPDLAVSDGTNSVGLEVYTPTRLIIENYVNDLLVLATDHNQPICVQYTPAQTNGASVSPSGVQQFVNDVAALTQGVLPYAGTLHVSPSLDVRLKLASYGCWYVAPDLPAMFGSPYGLQTWLASLSRLTSMSHKYSQLSSQDPTVLVVNPNQAMNPLHALGALGILQPNPWSTWQWPTWLPPQCKGILLWWYQLTTSAPWEARFLVRKSHRQLLHWLIQALGVPVIEI